MPLPFLSVNQFNTGIMSKIVLIEDDPLLCEMYELMLRTKGYEIHSEMDSEKGLAYVKAISPDLLLLDIMMPHLNGLQVLEALRSDEQTKAVRVLVLSNLYDEVTVKKALALGAIGYIVKSEYGAEQIMALVEDALTHHP